MPGVRLSVYLSEEQAQRLEALRSRLGLKLSPTIAYLIDWGSTRIELEQTTLDQLQEINRKLTLLLEEQNHVRD